MNKLLNLVLFITLFLALACSHGPNSSKYTSTSTSQTSSSLETSDLLQQDVMIKESLQKTKIEYLSKLANSDYDFPSLSSLCYLKDFERAKVKISDLYEKNKNNFSYWNLVGNCYYLQNEDYVATLYYKKSLELKPRNVVALNNLGVLMLKKKNVNRALKYFQEAHKLSPSSITPMLNIASLYLYYGHSKRAALFFETLHSLAPLDAEVSKGLLLSYALDARKKEARELLLGLPLNQKEYIDLQAHEWVKYIETGD